MGATGRLAAIAAVTGAAVLVAACGGEDRRASPAGGVPTFSHPRTIDNRYLPLTERGRRCVMRGNGERGVLTLLRRTRRFTVAGQAVDAVVVRDQAFEEGRLVESTLDYFAEADDGTVYYLGEQVRNIRNGKVRNRAGSWLLGRDTDVPGVAMPADPTLGAQWHNEDVPGITTESDRVEETGLRLKARGRVRTDLIRTSEFIQPEGEVEWKVYAPGIGILVEYDEGGRTTFAGCR